MHLPFSPCRGWSAGLLFLAALNLSLPSPCAAAPVSFRNEVMAVLSRAGCNAGACHGNLNGKNGFKLSLRGENPDFDLIAITRHTQGRRVDPLSPAESLLLTKATGTVAHEGGKRFSLDSPEYRLLRDWIAAGALPDGPRTPTLRKLEVTPEQQVLVAPRRSVRLKVMATFSDGQQRDVTPLAAFEVSNPIARVSPQAVVTGERDGETTILVRYLEQQLAVALAFVPARPDFVWHDPPEHNYIDQQIDAKLRTLRIAPAGLCTDAEFLRRATLDTLGRIPTLEETQRFLADRRPDRRARLIDALLQRPEFADFWAMKWSDLLRNEEKVLDRKGVEVFHQWIRQTIADGKPLNEFAREILLGRGSTYSHPAANYYRALRDPQTRAETTAQVFLGVRLQCARCHNHPFDHWTQNDYHTLAAFFARVQYRILSNNRRDKLDKHEFDGEQIVWQDRTSEGKHPVTGAVLRPRLPGQDTECHPNDDRLQILADWVASPENPYFARAQANRIWFHLMGRGIVEPNDDFRASNPAVNPALLEALAADLVAQHFDLRALIRRIMNSRTYQQSAIPNETNREDEINFSHTVLRPLQAEQLLDSLAQVTGVKPRLDPSKPLRRAVQMPAPPAVRRGRGAASEGERFLSTFGKPGRLLSCECERSEETTLAQAFQLITGKLLNEMLSEEDNRLGKLLSAGRSNPQIVEELYLVALNRPPSDQERSTALAFVARGKDRRTRLEDLLWGLVNSKEFLLRH